MKAHVWMCNVKLCRKVREKASACIREELTATILATILAPSAPRLQPAIPILTIFLLSIAASSSSEAAWPILLPLMSIELRKWLTRMASAIALIPSAV